VLFPYVPTVHPEDAECKSASEIDTYGQCARKWGWVYLAGFREPPHPSAVLGSRTHTQLERYLSRGYLSFMLEDGSPDESGEIAQAGLPYLPEPGTPGMIIEGSFASRSEETGIVYRGFKDLELPGLVHDHKTTGNPRYALTAETLPWNTQAIIYAQDHLDAFRVDTVNLRWLYLATKGARKAWPVDVTLDRATVEDRMRVVESIALEMKEIKGRVSASEVLSLPPNANACEGYGGCPHRHRCNLSQGERLKSIMSTSVLASIRARKEALEARKAPEPEALEPETALDPVPINPPESALPAAQPTGIAPAPEAAKGYPSSWDVAQEPVKPAAVEDKPKRARAKRVETEAPEVPAPLVAGIGAFALYVDCIPVRGRAVTHLSELVAKAAETIKNDPDCDGAADYRFIPYGKGPGVLSLAVLSVAKGCDAIALSTRTPEGAACLSALEGAAVYVVRGLP